MRIRRTLPPAAPPVSLRSLFHGLAVWAGLGDAASSLSQELRRYFGVEHVFLTSSGKAAMVVALCSLRGLMPGRRKVIIPAYTCYSVPSAVIKAGFVPIVCDIAESGFDYDYRQLRDLVDDETICVVAIHLFGIPADVDRIAEICRDKGVFVLEDAAQAMGGMLRGRKLGTIGDAGFFSLGRGKNITCGDGGILLTRSETIARALKREVDNLPAPSAWVDVRKFLSAACMTIFIRPSLYWIPASIPFLRLGETVFNPEFPVERMTKLAMGLLHGWEGRLERANKARVENGVFFRRFLRDSGSEGEKIPYNRLPLITSGKEIREQLYNLSKKRGLGLSPMYPASLGEIKELPPRSSAGGFPNAHRVAERLVSIPTHEFLTARDRASISALFSECGLAS